MDTSSPLVNKMAYIQNICNVRDTYQNFVTLKDKIKITPKFKGTNCSFVF